MLIASTIVVVLWILSYKIYLHESVDIHLLGRRVKLIDTQGSIFFEWSEIRRTPAGGWDPGAEVEIDELFYGFDFYVWPGHWTRAGAIIVPNWAILVLLPIPVVLLSIRYRKRCSLQ